MESTTTTRGRGRPRKNAPKANNTDKQEAKTSSNLDEPIIKETTKPMAEEQEENNGFNVEDAEIVNDEYTPLGADVEFRGYEQGNAQLSDDDSRIDIPQAALTFDSEEREDIPDAPTSNQQPNNQQGANTSFPQGGKQSEEKSHWENNHSTHSETTTETPAEKRRNATKMADTLLMVYRENVPTIFKTISKFNEGKISKMELNGEIDRSMPILADGTTVGSYIKRVNLEIDSTFVVSDEQCAEIREPLIDYLMEKDLKLTPSQRVWMALGGQVISFGLAAVQQWQLRRHEMMQFQEFHAEWRGQKRDIPQPRPQREEYVAEEIPRERRQSPTNQRSTPMDNLTDHELHDANMMENEETTYTVETVEDEAEIDLDDYMNAGSVQEALNEDIPTE